MNDYPREPHDEVSPLITLPVNMLGDVSEWVTLVSCSTTLGEMVTSAKSWTPILGIEQLTVKDARVLITECDDLLSYIDEVNRAIINVKRELKL